MSVKEVQETLDEVDKERINQKSKIIVTRSKGDKPKLETRFKEDVNNKIKNRWLGIKGLDGSIELYDNSQALTSKENSQSSSENTESSKGS